MGATILSDSVGFAPADEPAPPMDWAGRSPETPFDWNEDGRPDALAFNGDDDTVAINWGAGAITVSGVRSRFGWDDPIRDPDTGIVYVLEPPSEAAVATVADVTGDGHLDLIVAHGGAVAVLAGNGADSVDLTVSFDQVGTETNGWLSPPLPYEEDGLTLDLPIPIAEPEAVWDVDGDGVNDFRAIGRSGRGSRYGYAYYLGRRCTTEQP